MPSIICEQNEHPPISDVVFIVEDTADMAPTIEEFTSSYIVPTLDHFNGGKKKALSVITINFRFVIVKFRFTRDCRKNLVLCRVLDNILLGKVSLFGLTTEIADNSGRTLYFCQRIPVILGRDTIQR